MTKKKKSAIAMSPEQRKAWTPVLLGLLIFGVISAPNTAVSSAYYLFSQKFEISTTTVVWANSFMTAAAFLFM